MKQWMRRLQSMSRSVIVLIVQCAMVLTWGGALAPVAVRAQEPTPAPADAVTPLDVNRLEITGAEKLDRGPYRSIVWSPDGTKALVSKTGRPHRLHQSQREGASSIEGLWVGMKDLWVVDWASGQEELLVDTAYRWAWSPDGSSVAYIAPVGESGVPGELYVIDLATRSSRRIAEADIVQSYEQPFWLQTGEIVYVASGHLWSVQPDGSDLHQLNDLHLNHIIPEGSKDLAPYNGPVRDFEISPTGKYIAYHDTVQLPDSRTDYRTRLWLSALDGQNAHVIDENGIERAWSPDGRHLAYKSRPEWDNPWAANLMVVDAETGEQRLLYEPPHPLSLQMNIIWSPGSDALAFREDPGVGEEPYVLWFIEADGSEQKSFQDVELIQSPNTFMTWAKNDAYLLVFPDVSGGAAVPWRLRLGTGS